MINYTVFVRPYNILSVQSHVAYGYVGNRAAVFPLQRLGHEVTVINTVQFSNHTGYGQWTGQIFTPEHIQDMLVGLDNLGILSKLDATLSGYLGEAGLGQAISDTVQKFRGINPKHIYCCDPVIGDVGRGVFVKPSVAEYFKTVGLTQADIITPNQFELNYLTDIPINNLHDVMSACKKLRSQGPEIILVTSVVLPDVSANIIDMLVDTEEGTWLIRSPKLDVNPPPNGAGDATAAIFLAKYLETKNVVSALEHTMAAIFAIFKATFHAKTRELQIVASQDEIARPQQRFKAEKIS